MSIAIWLNGLGPKPALSTKFDKEIPQSSNDWHQQAESGKWHCTQYAGVPKSRGHDTPAKTTNHARHAKHSYVCNKYEIVEKGHENRAKKKNNRNMHTTGIRKNMLVLLWQSLLFQTTPAEIKKMIKVAYS